MEDKVRYDFIPIFPDFWSEPSYDLRDLFSPFHPQVVCTSKEAKGEVLRFLSSEDWKAPLETLSTWEEGKTPLGSLSSPPTVFPACPERVLIEGTGSDFYLDGEKVTGDLSKSLANHLGLPTEKYRDQYFFQELTHDLLGLLHAQKRYVFFVCHLKEDSFRQNRLELWNIAFSWERNLTFHTWGVFPATVFKFIEDYDERDRPSFCDLSKYLVNGSKIYWSWGELRKVLCRMFPSEVRDTMTFRKAMEALFTGKVRIPKDLWGWDTPRIWKLLKKHGYLEK